MNRHKIRSIGLIALIASLSSFASNCYYYDNDYDRRYRSDYSRRYDDRYYDRRYDWRYDDRYYDNRYSWRHRDRDRYDD